MGGLFVLEGPDGVGKTTVVTAVADYLTAAGYETIALSFPGKEQGGIGLHIYTLHHDPSQFAIESVSPICLQLLHVVAHIDSIEKRVLPLLKRGTVILLDRYWWSTWAYGRLAGISVPTLRAILAPEFLVWSGVQPTTLFLLHRSRANADAKLIQAYKELRRKESSKYEVLTLANNSELCHVTAKIGEHITEKLRSVDYRLKTAASK